jgi:hypothetical protein
MVADGCRWFQMVAGRLRRERSRTAEICRVCRPGQNHTDPRGLRTARLCASQGRSPETSTSRSVIHHSRNQPFNSLPCKDMSPSVVVVFGRPRWYTCPTCAFKPAYQAAEIVHLRQVYQHGFACAALNRSAELTPKPFG